MRQPIAVRLGGKQHPRIVGAVFNAVNPSILERSLVLQIAGLVIPPPPDRLPPQDALDFALPPVSEPGDHPFPRSLRNRRPVMFHSHPCYKESCLATGTPTTPTPP